MAAAKVLLDAGHRPRRTVRVVLFANEENGFDGARAYAEREFDINRLAAQFEGYLVGLLPAGARGGEVPIDFSLARRSGS